MNEKQAREIYKPFEAYKTFPIAFMKVGDVDYAQILAAKGYLEALDKAKGLEEAAKEVAENDCCVEPTYTERPNDEGDDVIEDTVFCGKCELCKLREALAKYRSEK